MRRSNTEECGDGGSGSGHVLGHRHPVGEADGLVLTALFRDVERDEQAHDDLAVLSRGDVTGGVRPTVAVAVDVQDRRPVGLTAAQEVAVQRVDAPVVGDGQAGGARSLRCDLAAEQARAADVVDRVHAPEDVAVELFEVEEVEQLGDVAGLGFTACGLVGRRAHAGEP